jgi:hypothetical protein
VYHSIGSLKVRRSSPRCVISPRLGDERIPALLWGHRVFLGQDADRPDLGILRVRELRAGRAEIERDFHLYGTDYGSCHPARSPDLTAVLRPPG